MSLKDRTKSYLRENERRFLRIRRRKDFLSPFSRIGIVIGTISNLPTCPNYLVIIFIQFDTLAQQPARIEA